MQNIHAIAVQCLHILYTALVVTEISCGLTEIKLLLMIHQIYQQKNEQTKVDPLKRQNWNWFEVELV